MVINKPEAIQIFSTILVADCHYYFGHPPNHQPLFTNLGVILILTIKNWDFTIKNHWLMGFDY